jgi:hypothetical protein
LVRLLRRLEIPDKPCKCSRVIKCTSENCVELAETGKCDCSDRIAPACPHILKRDHNFSLKKWAELLTRWKYKDYHERPVPSAPAKVLSRQARVDVLAKRRKNGESLWHPGDLQPDQVDQLGRRQTLTANGRPVQKELVVMGRKK